MFATRHFAETCLVALFAVVSQAQISGVTAGAGLTGGGTSGNVTLAIDTTQVPTLGSSNTFTGAQTIKNNLTVSGNVSLPFSGLSATQITANSGVGGECSDCAVSAVTMNDEGVYSYSYYGPYSVLAASNANGSGDAGVAAVIDWPSTSRIYGVLSTNASGNFGAGVFGVVGDGAESGTGSSWTGVGAGVWGDGSGAGNYGVLATADAQSSVFAENNASGYYTIVAYNSNSSGSPFYAYNGAGKGCYVDSSGNINCTGSKNAVVAIDGGQRKVALSAIESPKNWFEDFGSGQLSNGSAVVTIDPEYQETVNTAMDYKVFPVPRGDCKGLYITNETPSSFEVRELGSGTSNVGFDYRIVALRKNYENIRMADRTNDLDAIKTVATTGTPFRFETSKMKLPKRPAPKVQPPKLP
jgi:hypothetical protein